MELNRPVGRCRNVLRGSREPKGGHAGEERQVDLTGSRILSTLLALFAVAAVHATERTPGSADQPLLVRPGAGTQAFTGLDSVSPAGNIPRWPVALSAPDSLRQSCPGAHCTQWQELDLVLNRAAKWMAAFPTDELRFDAAMILTSIRETIDSESLRTAFERARVVADRDDDNPGRRLWVRDLRLGREHTSGWQVPADGKRVNTNRVVGEALFCRENGWRVETMHYVCGPMRDDGGYHTTHGLWALSIVQRNGCMAQADLEPCVRSIQKELAAKQPNPLTPKATLDIDIYAERLLTLLLTGYPDVLVDQWAQDLMHLQTADGSWGVPQEGSSQRREPGYYRYHTTAISTWALAEWFRRAIGAASDSKATSAASRQGG